MSSDGPDKHAARLVVLSQGLRQLGLEMEPQTLHSLIEYIELLAKWNSTYNLTAIRDPDQMVFQHLLDSLAITPYLRGKRLLDIGTGPGLPGIPLALIRPELNVVLLESRGKKTRFIQQAVIALGLLNVEIVNNRVENYQPTEKFDTLVSRAFAPLSEMLGIAGHLCCETGQILAMKGKYPTAELAEIEADKYQVDRVIELHVPSLEAERHLVMITPIGLN
ncbi:16S rRNA (guanine(527)-N(7))-methyltransferase RsmG [Pseudomonadota bacterium]